MINSIRKDVKNHALSQLGFDDCRFTKVDSPNNITRYKEWLSKNFHGEMSYLERHTAFKEDLNLLLPDVKSAIVLAKNYKNTNKKHLNQKHKIARYAVGQDYHEVISKKLSHFERYLNTVLPEHNFYAGVDSRPIPERDLALKAGIGFRGKNSMVIKPGLGSYFFLAVILSTYEFMPDQPSTVNCGQCRLCLDACPTGAITDDYEVDSRKCISYLTIEKKTPLNDGELQSLNNWMFGCDICQEVCPYNHKQGNLTNWKEFDSSGGVGFSFFDKQNPQTDLALEIPKHSAMYRSRKNIGTIWKNIHASRPGIRG
ncbi:tRNA epoxyqueuosine(34) reductase QueG [PVC group bacterium]|nr:tRNA epoxyqueuosine(34) reductase QueG [PVC group bacterium]